MPVYTEKKEIGESEVALVFLPHFDPSFYTEIARIAATPEARDWFLNAGAEAGILTLSEMAALVQREHARFGQFIHETGLKAE